MGDFDKLNQPMVEVVATCMGDFDNPNQPLVELVETTCMGNFYNPDQRVRRLATRATTPAVAAAAPVTQAQVGNALPVGAASSGGPSR